MNYKLHKLGRKAEKASILVSNLYKKPFINSTEIIEMLNISKPSANELIKDLEDIDILKETTGYKRNRIFYFKEYYDLFEQ